MQTTLLNEYKNIPQIGTFMLLFNFSNTFYANNALSLVNSSPATTSNL